VLSAMSELDWSKLTSFIFIVIFLCVDAGSGWSVTL